MTSLKKYFAKGLGGLLLVGVLFTALAGFAFAADSKEKTEKLTIREGDVIYGDKGDLTALKMTSTTGIKEVWFEGAALKAAAKNKKTFGIKMDEYTFKFSPEAFFTDDWQKALDSGDPVEVKLLVEADALLDINTHFDSPTQSPLGNYNFTSYGFTVEAHIYVAGARKYTYTTFAKPMNVTFDYKASWNRNPLDMPEKTLTLAWLDKESTFSSSKKWTRLATKTNLTDKVLTANMVNACGFYLPIAVKGADNTGTNVGDGSTSTGTDDGSVTTPTGGVPTGHWAENDIMYMQQNKVVPGDLSSVQVDKAITRGEFAAYLVNTLGLTEDLSLAGKFKDITTENPYYSQILTGAFNKILNGNTATTFAPNASISRQEMAVMLDRALTVKNISVTSDSTKLSSLKDAGKVASWAKSGVISAISSGLMGSKDNNSFKPADNTTWAEAVVILSRLHKQVVK